MADTRIDFYHDAPDKLAIAARIVHKAVAQGHRLTVLAPDTALAEAFDRLLWTQPATGFLPHCRADSPLAAETPVLIATSLETAANDDVLINLGHDLPDGFAHYARLIEIVGRDDADKAPARERFRHYRDAGYEINRHDLAERQ